jgi:hypothetical protein
MPVFRSNKQNARQTTKARSIKQSPRQTERANLANRANEAIPAMQRKTPPPVRKGFNREGSYPTACLFWRGNRGVGPPLMSEESDNELSSHQSPNVGIILKSCTFIVNHKNGINASKKSRIIKPSYEFSSSPVDGQVDDHGNAVSESSNPG